MNISAQAERGPAPNEPGIGIDWDWEKVQSMSVSEFTRTITG